MSVFATATALVALCFVGAAAARRLYVVPPHEIHVARIAGLWTTVRRPGPHLAWGRLEHRRTVRATPFAVERHVAAPAADGAAVELAACFQLRIVDPVRYLEHAASFRLAGPQLARAVLADEITRRTSATLADAADLRGSVGQRMAAGLARFGVHLEDVVTCVTVLDPVDAPAGDGLLAA